MRRVDLREGDARQQRRSALLAGVGDGVAATALALLTAGLTRDPLTVAMVVAAQHLPWALVAVAGRSAWADADRRTVLGLGITLRAVAVAVVGLLALAGVETVLFLLAAALAVGVGEALADQAEAGGAGAGAEAGFDRSPGRNAMVGLAMVGLPAGGLAYELAAALPFLLDVGVFAVSALAALSLRAPLPAEPRAGVALGPHPLVGPGGIPALASGTAAVTVVSALSAVAGGAVLGVLVLFALDDLGLGAPAFGLLLAGLAGSSALGAFLAPSIGRVVGLRAGLALALAVSGAGHVAAGLVVESDRPLAAIVALGVGAGGSMAAAVLARVLLHVGAGRVVEGVHLAAFHARVWGGIPVGALLGGVTAATLGVPRLVVASGLVSVAAAVVSVVVVPGRLAPPGEPPPRKMKQEEKIG